MNILIPALLFGASLALLLPAPQGATCSERVVLKEDGATSWGSVTNSGIGPLSVAHVFTKEREVIFGPNLAAIRTLEATDFAFLDGSDPKARPEAIPELSGDVILEGFPARATRRETVGGRVYAPDTMPPGVWIMLDSDEPLVGGFSGGCVRNAAHEPLAVIMGASSMKLNGETRHFARVIPIRDALREAQGHRWTPRSSLAALPVPERKEWK